MKAGFVLAIVCAAAGIGASACAASEAPLPALNLSIELRLRQDGPEMPRSGRGSVVVGTQGSTPLASSVTVTTATAPRPGDDTLQQVRVLNGAVAQLRLSRLLPLRRVQWTWAAPRARAGAASAGSAAGGGLAETTQWVDTARGFEVRPSWPGGPAPVRLEIRAEIDGEAPSDASGHSAGPRRLIVSTTVGVPLGEWFVIGRIGPPLSPSESGLTVSTAARGQEGAGRIEVRVLAP